MDQLHFFPEASKSQVAKILDWWQEMSGKELNNKLGCLL
jgi:hypothetical protein